MNIKNLPMNETFKYAEQAHTSLMLTRTEKEKLVAQYIDKNNSDEVAKMYLWENGESELVSYDATYWSYTLNDRPASSNDIKDIVGRTLKKANIDLEKRLIAINL